MNIKPQKTGELTKLGELIEDMSVAMLTTFNEAEDMSSRSSPSLVSSPVFWGLIFISSSLFLKQFLTL